jgi:hypothetical protein
MRISGILFIIGGIFWSVAGFATYASDIQLGIALSGICMAGIGSVLVGLSNVQKDLLNLWLWVKKSDKDEV